MKLTVLKHLHSKHLYSNVHKRKLIKEKLTHLKKQTLTPPPKKTCILFLPFSREKKCKENLTRANVFFLHKII